MASMSVGRVRLGRRGEAWVGRRLAGAGWRLLETNWRRAEGEIDIVAIEGDVLVLVEVRTRASRSMGTAEESVGPRKCARLARLARRYVYEAGWAGPVRVDVVTVFVPADGARPVMRHYRNAVTGEWA